MRLEYPGELGTIWMLNNQDEYISSLDESSLGRSTLDCRKIICAHDDYPLASLCYLDLGVGDSAAVVELVAQLVRSQGMH